MISDVERYHGAALRDLIICSQGSLEISVCDDAGRINSYLVNRRLGVHIKHSTSRTAPWSFTFTEDNLDEIGRLSRQAEAVWLLLVCGRDGILALALEEFQAINPSWAKATKFVRVDRDKRTMYRVYGTNGQLGAAKPRGTLPIIADLRNREVNSR